MTTATETHLAGGYRVWFALVAPIAAWAVHIVAAASLVPLTCDHDEVEWVLHGLTAAMSLVVVLALWVSYGMVRAGQDDEESGSEAGRTRFLGLLGLIIGFSNLALILLEGSYVIFLKPCA